MGSSGRTVGAPEGSVSISSAMWAHQRRMTGWSGSAAMAWSRRRHSTAKSVSEAASRWME